MKKGAPVVHLQAAPGPVVVSEPVASQRPFEQQKPALEEELWDAQQGPWLHQAASA
jgi:hypothetical protein